MYMLIAQLIGFIGPGLYVISFQCKSSRKLLILQLVGSLAYAVSIFMLGGYSGFAVAMIAVLNYLILSYGIATNHRWACWKGWGVVFTLLYIGATAMTWQGWFDILPCIGTGSTTLTNWTRNGKKIRIARLFVNSPTWMIYDFFAHSYSGVISEIISIISILISVYRYGWDELDRTD